MALAAEAAELLEIFQWLTEEQSKGIVDSEEDMAAKLRFEELSAE